MLRLTGATYHALVAHWRYGRNLLDPEAFERDFGLKVALNTVDPDSLRSVDCRTFEELTLQTRRQVSRASAFDTFGLNVTQDLVRQVMGVPKNKDFAKRVAGSDGLMIAVPLKFTDLGKKCVEMLDAFASTEYKKHFAFIDYLHCERDPTKIKKLNDELLQALRKGEHDSMHLAPPEPLDPHDVDGFTYGGGNDVSPDLDIEDLVKTFDDVKTLTVEDLRQTRVGVRYGGATHSAPATPRRSETHRS